MSINIFLDNYYNQCFAGQTISGRIECTFNSNKKLRAITVKFRGDSNTSWTETETQYNYSTKKDEDVNVEYYAKETHINAEYNLIQGADNFSLPPGKHVYPFSYILPANIPSSFEGQAGNIRYYIEVVVNRPWKFNYKARVPLNVVSPIDLNFIPGLRDPVALSIDKIPCSCWCNDSGVLTLNLSVPVTGYVPGQEINIGSYVQNLTNISAERVQYKVIASYKYIAHFPSYNSTSHHDEVIRCVERGIGAHGDKSWTSTLIIPTNRIYPNLSSCSIINVHYILKAKIVLPRPHKNLQVDIPITIGSVALSGVNTSIPGPPSVESMYAGASAPYLSAGNELTSYPPAVDAPSLYPEKTERLETDSKDTTVSAPPPSYEESQPHEKI